MKVNIKRLSNYSNESIISELKRVAKELNKKCLTGSDIKTYSKINPSLLNRRFGSIEKALELAGLESSRHFRYSTEDLLGQIDIVWKNLGRQPFSKEIGKMGKYSTNTYLRHFGSWLKALESYVEWKNKIDLDSHKIKEPNIIIPTQKKVKNSKPIEYGEPIDFLVLIQLDMPKI